MMKEMKEAPYTVETESENKNKQKNANYFPLEANLLYDKNESILLEKHGAKGLGIYIMILLELRRCQGYQCNINAIYALARLARASIHTLKKIVNDCKLFEITTEDGSTFISSHYLNRVMGAYDEKVQKMSEGAKRGLEKKVRGENGRFTRVPGAIEKNRIEKNKKNTATAVKEKPQDAAFIADEVADVVVDKNKKEAYGWEHYLTGAVNDKEWFDTVGMRSGLGALFLRNQKQVVDIFRQHVIATGNSEQLHSVRDVKYYFFNFLREGTPTQKRTMELLQEREREEKEESPYRFETIDPVTGARSYYGNPIPADAPPRPNNNAAWGKIGRCWVQ